MNRTEIEQQLIDRAQRDHSFRQRLVSNPREALAQELSITIPPAIRVQVLEEDPNSLMLVLPAAQGELSDLELEGVAGGKDSPLTVTADRPHLG